MPRARSSQAWKRARLAVLTDWTTHHGNTCPGYQSIMQIALEARGRAAINTAFGLDAAWDASGSVEEQSCITHTLSPVECHVEVAQIAI